MVTITALITLLIMESITPLPTLLITLLPLLLPTLILALFPREHPSMSGPSLMLSGRLPADLSGL